ncbi:hypothetical protein [Aurantimonas coralicida]|uniref:hypothetical protein n=1 Tax=Aurantimonas coralicida TaxID=182270 RepID=UPI001E3259B3|nr:hypothetical protein [Aurantimonas coralicida]MCD1644296.1 hypothetical protein [Aurantimonas coralicida]
MSARLTPFRVHFDAIAGSVPAPVVITAAKPRDAETEALRCHPDRTVSRVKRDKSGGQS